MQKIRIGDIVKVRTGKDAGREGEVLERRTGGRLLIAGINILKHFVRRNPQANEEGGIKEREAPIRASNVMILNPRTKRGDRVGIKVLEDGKKVRYFKSDGEVIDAD